LRWTIKSANSCKSHRALAEGLQHTDGRARIPLRPCGGDASRPYTAGKVDFVLLRVFAGGLAERFRRFLHIQNVVDNLEG